MTISEPTDRLLAVIEAVQGCTLCPGVQHSHILSNRNGISGAGVMFIGEAPGRLGAGRTGIPFHGDESGRRFEALLGLAGLQREEVFITNAILCNPIDDRGRNRAPLQSETARCRPFLEQQIEAVDPAIVVTLGQVALSAIGRIASHDFSLRTHCAQPEPWQGRLLVPLYHPGRQSTLHRRETDQRSDWQKLGHIVSQALRAER